MSKSMKQLVLLAVAQSAKGTPGTPVAATNAILCRGFVPVPIKGKFVERNTVGGSKGNHGGIFAGEHCVFEFQVEWAGSGVVATAPKFGPLNLGCNMSETVTAVTSVVYNLIAGEGPYLTFLADLDGLQFKMTDARGTKSWTINSEDIPVMKYTFTGKYWPMTDTAFPSGISFTGFTKPLTVGAVNTPTFTLDAIALVVKSFGLDLANTVTWKNYIGNAGAESPDRKGTASAVFELTTVAVKNWGETVRLGTAMPLNLVHGTTAGNICALTGPLLQINAEPTITDDGGTAMLSCSFAVMPTDAGNDELVETFT